MKHGLYRQAMRLEAGFLSPDGGATDEMMAKINALPGVIRPLKADDVIVRGVMLCNDLPFKDGRRRLLPSLLAEMAAVAPGIPVCEDHSPGNPFVLSMPVATTIEASVVQDAAGVNWLRGLFYMLRTPDGEAHGAQVDGGIIKECSIGIFPKRMTCSICGANAGNCDHEPGAQYDGRTALWEASQLGWWQEWSFVYEGLAQGTRYFLAAAAQAARGAEAVDDEQLEIEMRARLADPVAAYMAREPAPRENLDTWFAGSGGARQV